MTKTLKWRLEKLPTVSDLSTLLEQKIITEEEAKQILFTQSELGQRDEKSLKEEIRFLKKLVENLSESRTHIIKTIESVQVPYIDKGWYQPYTGWTTALTSDNATSSGTFLCSASGSGGGTDIVGYEIGGFSDIKSF